MRTATGALAALLVTLASGARAANEDGVPQSTDAMLSGATVVSREGAAGAWYNPAALGGLPRSSVQLSASIYTLGVRTLGGLVETRLPWVTYKGSTTSVDFTSLPSCVSFALRLSPRVSAAVGLFSPTREYFTIANTFETRSPVQADGSRQYYAQSVAYSLRQDSTQGGLSVGALVTDSLRLGLGAFARQDTVEQSLDLAYSLRIPDTLPTPNGFVGISSRTLVSRFGAYLTVGALWDAARWLSIALAVRSPSFGIAATGSTAETAYAANPSTQYFARQTADASTPTLTHPARATLAAEVRIKRARLTVEGDVRHPLEGDGVGADKWVPNARVGAIVRAADDLWLGAGLFTDLGGSTIAAGGAEVDFFGATAGVQFRSRDVVRLRNGSDGWDLRTTLGLRYALGLGHVGGLIIEPLGSSGSQAQPARATYSEVSVNIGTALEF